jgi:hypothetical protein
VEISGGGVRNYSVPQRQDRERIIVMTYGLSTRLFVENGPAVEAAKVSAKSRTTAYAVVWERLKQDERLHLVDGALKNAA